MIDMDEQYRAALEMVPDTPRLSILDYAIIASVGALILGLAGLALCI